MFNPITTASSAKAAARAELRTKKVLSLSANQYRLKQEIADTAKSAEATTKRITHLNWETQQAEDNGNPNAADIKERNGKSVVSLAKEVEGYANRTAELQKEVARLQEKIDDVVSGKAKFDYDAILGLADTFIHEATLESFISGEFEKEETSPEAR